MKRPHRCSRPQQHPDLDALRQLTEQIAQPSRPIVARQPELRRDVPPGDMHMRASASQRLSDPGQRLPAIHQHLKRSPRSRRGIGGSPQRSAGRRFQLIDPADTLQPATMTPTDRRLDALTRPSIHALNQARAHSQQPNPQGPEERRPAANRAPSERPWRCDAIVSDRRMSCLLLVRRRRNTRPATYRSGGSRQSPAAGESSSSGETRRRSLVFGTRRSRQPPPAATLPPAQETLI